MDTTFRYPRNSVKCFGCDKPLSPIQSCPDRIEICQECRKSPKLLQGANNKMNTHMLFAHGVK